MTDRPILFSGAMIRAIFEGRKSQTRRVIDFPGSEKVIDFVKVATDKAGRSVYEMKDKYGAPVSRPAGKGIIDYHYTAPIAVGDRLWAREAWCVDRPLDGIAPRDLESGTRPLWYLAGSQVDTGRQIFWSDKTGADYDASVSRGKYRPGMHMPRWMSRLTLTVTDVRIERLQSISEADAMAEGVIRENVIVDVHGSTGTHIEITANRYWGGHEQDEFEGHDNAVDAYFSLWDHINGAGSADKNPWVIAYTFTHEIRNIDDRVAR